MLFRSSINLKEEILWEEVYQGGIKSQAGKILSKKYPEVFKSQNEVNNLVQAINLFTAKEFGFLFSQMSMDKLLDLMNAMIDYKLNKRNFLGKLYAYLRRKNK